MKQVLFALLIISICFAVIFSGCLKQKSNDNNINDGNTQVSMDNITFINDCSGNIEGNLAFNVYEEEFYTEENNTNPAYNITYEISIKKGETKSYTIKIPDNIENNYSKLFFKISLKDNSTQYTRSGPWVNSEVYKIYETEEGINWDFIDFDM